MADVRTVPLTRTQLARLLDLRNTANEMAIRFDEACNTLALSVIADDEAPRATVALSASGLTVTVA